VEGNVTLKKENGEIIKEAEKLFLCRCGASVNKPFCDGSHNKIEFDNE
jgi:CDGSH-type Zn-finger protein